MRRATPFAALALIVALQWLAGTGPVLAFPLYLIVVLLSALRAGRAVAMAAAGVAAAAILIDSLLASGPPADLISAILLAAVLPVVAFAIAEVTRQAQIKAREVELAARTTAAGEQRLGAMVEAARLGLALADSEGRFTLVNRQLERILGRDRDLLQATSLVDVVAETDRPAVREAVSGLRDGTLTRWEAEVSEQRPDHSLVPVAIAISRAFGAGTGLTLLVEQSDISGRRRVDSLRDGLTSLQELLVSSEDWDLVLPELLAGLCLHLDWDSALYWTVDHDDEVMRCRQMWPADADPPSTSRDLAGLAPVLRGDGLVGGVWQSGEVAEQTMKGSGTAVAVPVIDGEAVIGVIELLSSSSSPVPHDKIAVLTTVGLELGRFIRRSVTEQALRRSEADHRAIYEHSPIGIARVSAEGELVEANPAFLEMLEHDLDAMRDKAWPDLLRAYDQAASRRQRAPLLAGITERGSVQVRAATASGRWLWLQLTATSIPDSSGRPEHVLVMVEDVTTVRETSDRLADALDAQRTANANLERLDRTKTEFLSITSHEFRTALTGIQGFSELIRDGGLDDDEIRAYGGYIFNDADRVNRLIGDMLDLDRMESGRMAIRAGDVEVNDLLAEAVARARTGASNLDFKADLDPGLAAVTGDRDRLTQVVSNLLNNAVKYSPEGGTVTVASRIEGGFALISVSDTGLGIPPDEIGHVFERFRRVRSGAAQAIPGTGLGLAIVKQIVEMHGGRIWVESAVGHGSSFHFTIPLAPVSLARSHPRRG